MKAEFEIVDTGRFGRYVAADAALDVLHRGSRFAEGPVWFGDVRMLIWSDIPASRMFYWVEGQGTGLFREPTNFANGNTRDRQGRLITCEGGARRLTRTEHDGRITVLAEAFEGKRLNSPNDVVSRSDDGLWFTDPDYAIRSDYIGVHPPKELDRDCVFRLDPRGGLTVATDEMVKPNGLAFSPDESILYVADSGANAVAGGPRHIVAFDVDENRLRNRRVLAEIAPGEPDGLRTDVDGNIWVSAADGVHCLAPDGRMIGKLLIPEIVGNITFGGRDRNRLFIAASTTLYAVELTIRGAGVC